MSPIHRVYNLVYFVVCIVKSLSNKALGCVYPDLIAGCDCPGCDCTG